MSDPMRIGSDFAPSGDVVGFDAPVYVVFIGLIYTAIVWFGAPLLALFGIPLSPSLEYLSTNSSRHVAGVVLLRLVPALLLALGIALHPALRRALGSESPILVAASFLGVAGLSVLLAAAGLLGWTWQEATNTTASYVSLMARAERWVQLGALILTWTVVIPFIEESVYRFGVLHLIATRMNSVVGGVVASAFLFGTAHAIPLMIGHDANMDYAIRYGFAAFVLGLLLAATFVWRRGRLWVPIAIHAGRNMAEWCVLVILVSSERAP